MKCHCCGSNYVKLFENTFKCELCEHIHRRYSGNATEYHKNQYRKIERRDISEINEKGEIQELFHTKRDNICKRRIAFVEEYLLESDECLDIGSGAGTYSNKLKKHVKNVQCTELDPSLIAECQRLGFEVYEEDFLKLQFKNRFDIVSAWHVLEHVDDVESFLGKCAQLTKRYCIIEVPLLQSLSGTGRTRKLVDPSVGTYDGHAHYFNKTSFVQLAEKYFSIIEIKEGVQSPALFAVMEPKEND